MSVHNNPRTITDGLIFCVDKENYRSNMRKHSLVDYKWDVNVGADTTSSYFYSLNGDAAENQRVIATDPWGNNAVVWQTDPAGDFSASGGFHYGTYPINNEKTYRFSVWMRRISANTSGSYYFGMYGSPYAILRAVDDVEQGNPYFHFGDVSGLTQNTWYLFTGFVRPHFDTSIIPNPETGVYTINDGKISALSTGYGSLGGDAKFRKEITGVVLRAYHYYSVNSNCRIQIYDPRIDLIDGGQPSLLDLLRGVNTKRRDLSGKGNDARILYSNANVTVSCTTPIPLSALSPNVSSTLDVWVKPTQWPSNSYVNGYGQREEAGTILGAFNYTGIGIRYQGGHFSNTTLSFYGVLRANTVYLGTTYYSVPTLNVYYNIVLVNNQAANLLLMYINGNIYSSQPCITTANGYGINASGAGNIGINKVDVDGGGRGHGINGGWGARFNARTCYVRNVGTGYYHVLWQDASSFWSVDEMAYSGTGSGLSLAGNVYNRITHTSTLSGL